MVVTRSNCSRTTVELSRIMVVTSDHAALLPEMLTLHAVLPFRLPSPLMTSSPLRSRLDDNEPRRAVSTTYSNNNNVVVTQGTDLASQPISCIFTLRAS